MNKNATISIVLLLMIGVGTYFILGSSDGEDSQSKNTNLEGNVALVNGVAITRETFDSQLAEIIASRGGDIEDAEVLLQTKTQILNNLITAELLSQGVLEGGIEIPKEDVDKEIQAIKDQIGSQEAFEEQLVGASLTEEQLRVNITNQLATQVFIRQNVDIEAVTVSEEEVRASYDEAKAAQPELPAFEDFKSQIERQLIFEKQQELIDNFIASLGEKADIETADLQQTQ
jgi:peptidyl-prolyl cis-trans isomerase SurA